jgi:hypothetical protein
MSTSASSPAAQRPDPGRARRRGRLIALAVLAACAVPVVAGYLAYHFFPPAGRVNYGELVDAKVLPARGLHTVDGAPFGLDPLGNLVLRFPRDADPRRMIKDLQRLLKYSRIG